MPFGCGWSPWVIFVLYPLGRRVNDTKESPPEVPLVFLTLWYLQTQCGSFASQLGEGQEFRVRMARSFHVFWGCPEVCLLEASLTWMRKRQPCFLASGWHFVNRHKALDLKPPVFLPYGNILKFCLRTGEVSVKFPQLEALLLVN